MPDMKQKPILAWHFLPDNGKFGYGDGRRPRPGTISRAKGCLVMCANGMHGSRRIIDALAYAPGAILQRVEMVPPLIVGDDKIVARGRRCLWVMDVTHILHEFGCRCAEDALALIDNPDERSLRAISTKRAWLLGTATDEELVAARDAARVAQDRRLRAMVSAARRKENTPDGT